MCPHVSLRLMCAIGQCWRSERRKGLRTILGAVNGAVNELERGAVITLDVLGHESLGILSELIGNVRPDFKTEIRIVRAMDSL